jgi:serine/threonine-protein kinase
VLHQIGVGALGPVFRTYEPSRDRLVAVKVFRLDITPEQSQALADELTRAAEAGLFHPSIVEPITAGVQGTLAYRAEEYVAAESLDVAMRHYAPAPIAKVLPITTQLAGAIDFARAAGVGHGALHPRDVFITPEEARVTGFGVADALERCGLRAPVRRPYSPPERIEGAPWSTPADVFSLAVITFELLTARRPSGTGEQIGALPASLGEHAESVRRVLVRAMDANPAGRYQSALAFAGALEAAARGEAVEEGAAAVEALSMATGLDAFATSEVPKASAVPETPTVPAETHEADDIASERDEDEAHWALTREEAAASADGAPEPALFDASAERAAGEALVLEAADLALHEPAPDAGAAPALTDSTDAPAAESAPTVTPPAPAPPEPIAFRPLAARTDHQRERRPAPPAAPRPRREPVVPRHPTVSLGAASDAQNGERPGVALLPLAVTLVAGLLLGFAAGYAVGGRNATQTTTVTSATSPARPPDRGDASAAGTTGAPPADPPPRSYSEGAVQPGAGQPSTPPAGPGDSPATATKPAAPPPAPVRRGRLVVRSTPAGASVTINGEWRGRTPLSLDELTFGKYEVRVVSEGYRVERRDVALSAADAARTLSFRLERNPAPAATRRPAPAQSAPREKTSFTGSVYVDSRPQGARITIDGKDYGTTPVRIPSVPIGSHVIRLELPNHRAWSSSLRVTAGVEARVTGSLDPIR